MKPPDFTARRFQAVLTPGITRPPAPLKVDEIMRVAGRVHAVVMRGDHT